MLAAAMVAGILAVTLVGGYSSSVADRYGSLRSVVVLARSLEPGREISPKVAASALTVRQVPGRFVPTATLSDPGDAVGLVTVSPLPAGSYLTAPGLEPPRRKRAAMPGAGKGRHAVELAVAGAGSLGGSGRVDVLVTSESDRGGGSTRVAARRVLLLGVGRPGQSDSGPGLTDVTLGLTRRQAITLVDAESFARRITVLPLAGR